ncbi:sigma 54-interacting transcriptional regulator [Mucilaginibacter sp. SMC90]|uniref:sigma 54-interacting transcriptional regulator n=1 Tax=Mucilaginibacter sp. SMC90 TaxID=2929803 RepID=UPI001FB38E81|nr:sigma 54-interacting transcriptional regulator [Mucilaginibacter sp. SMC90]UOE48824.1 sigma 54-interacting transcriptional regulator [Mucilaginibacter sp. SMC90]
MSGALNFSQAIEDVSWLAESTERLDSLSSFSRILATIQTAPELFGMLKSLISPVLGIKEFCIYAISRETASFRNIFLEQDQVMGMVPVCFRPEIPFNNIRGFEQQFRNGITSELPIDIDRLVSTLAIDLFVEKLYFKDSFLHQIIGLRLGKQLIGVCLFIFEGIRVPVSFRTPSMQFFCDQVSQTVNRITVNNTISKQQEERDLLLSLSIAIAKVRNQEQLQLTLSQHLKKYLGFSHTAIALYDESRKSYNLFSLDPHSKSKDHPEYPKLKTKNFELNDAFTRKMSATPYTVSFNLEDYASEDLPVYLRVNKECGIKVLWGHGFRTEEKTLGILVFFFDKATQLNNDTMALLTGIGHQISVAVSNILALQQVNKLLWLKSTMLSFGIELRMTKDIRLLSQIIKKQIQELLQVREFAITVISEDRSSCRLFFYDHAHEFVNNQAFRSNGANEISLDHELFREIMKSPTPLRFPANTLENSVFQDLLTPTDDDVLVGAKITIGDEAVGILLMTCEGMRAISAERQIFDSFCSQLGIIITNITAHQKLENQLKETDRYRQRLEVEKTYLFEEISTLLNNSEIVGTSKSLRSVYHLVSQVARSSSTVLILGETGTGKELFARAIHNNSPRKNKLMIKVNCAAIPPNLIESELFGHEKGSFTGATERRIGKFELAHGGTLFLDEVGEMPLDLQVKLLRALQEKEIERVGGKTTIAVDVRIIAATNRDLEEEMSAGRFRKDLYYRLNIFPISLPPLRERRDDIEVLVNHFIEKYSKRCGKNIQGIGPNALLDLKRYHWPGNIRELEHMIERSILLANTNIIKQVPLPLMKVEQVFVPGKEEQVILRTIDEHERQHILNILNHCGGRIAGIGNAAEILGVPPTTLNSKMRRLGIKRGHTL